MAGLREGVEFGLDGLRGRVAGVGVEDVAVEGAGLVVFP